MSRLLGAFYACRQAASTGTVSVIVVPRPRTEVISDLAVDRRCPLLHVQQTVGPTTGGLSLLTGHIEALPVVLDGNDQSVPGVRNVTQILRARACFLALLIASCTTLKTVVSAVAARRAPRSRRP